MTQHISHPDIQPTKEPQGNKASTDRERAKQEASERAQERKARAAENARQRPREVPAQAPRDPSQISLDRAADEGMTAPPDTDEN
jgi:hypothetical protein